MCVCLACRVAADVEDFVGVLLTHLYGLLEERARTLSGEMVAALLGLCGCCGLDAEPPLMLP